MVSREFADKLKATLESMNARLDTLEDTVQHTILDGLKQAADEYEDDARFSSFRDSYSDELSDYDKKYKALNGESADLASDIYEEVKGTEGYGTEGFDEGATVKSLLSVIDDKLASIQAAMDEVADVATDNGEPTEEQLAEEFKNYGK